MLNTSWSQKTLTEQLVLPQDGLHIYLIDVSQHNESTIKQLRYFLSSDEQQHADRFVTDQLRNRYIMAHGGLRKLLSFYAETEPEKIDYIVNDHGKPYLTPATNPHNIYFNLSHSEDACLVAIAGQEVGVDVESIDRVIHNYAAIVERYFHESEQSELNSLNEDSLNEAGQRQMFVRAWTRKEAFIKVIGQGLSYPINQVEVDVKEDATSFLKSVEKNEFPINDWYNAVLTPAENYTGAVVVQGEVRGVQLFCLDLC